MFTGAVPKPVVEQILRIVPFDDWEKVFVGCSGSFRVDRAIKARFPAVQVFSNDVSLLTVSMGRLALGEPVDVEFTGRLEFMEVALAGRSPVERVAAILVALDMARYKGANEHARQHFEHYRRNIATYLALAKARVGKFIEETRIDGFYAGDFQEQVARAAESGGGVIAFPPTYKGGYERLYRFLDDNTAWEAPAYGVWDPSQIEDFTLALEQAGARYCVLSDQRFEHLEPVTVYRNPTNKPVFTYANVERSSVRRSSGRSTPFRYTAVEPAELGPDAEVTIAPAKSEHMNFLKDKYLAKGIAHVTGMLNFLVLIDGRLAGGFIYAKSKFGDQQTIYLLSDFSLSRERKLSKLIAMLATCHVPVGVMERKLVQRLTTLTTTAFTTRPVSMKYRGIFQLTGRKPGFLQYQSEVRQQSPGEIYADWYRRFAK